MKRRSRRSGSKKSRKSKKSGKRKANKFIMMVTDARKKGLESFLYKGNKYVKRVKNGFEFYKKA
jgi:hypothetical protein